MIEVAHEQLIRSWRRLRDWLREDRQMLSDLEQLGVWVHEAKRYDAPLTGKHLAHACTLLERYGDEVDLDARELVALSMLEDDRRHQRERATRTRLRVLACAAAVAALAAGGLGVLALERGSAERGVEGRCQGAAPAR
jgi:hypothetical protein